MLSQLSSEVLPFLEGYFENTEVLPCNIQLLISSYRELNYQMKELMDRLKEQFKNMEGKHCVSNLKRLLIDQKEIGDQKLKLLQRAHELFEVGGNNINTFRPSPLDACDLNLTSFHLPDSTHNNSHHHQHIPANVNNNDINAFSIHNNNNNANNNNVNINNNIGIGNNINTISNTTTTTTNTNTSNINNNGNAVDSYTFPHDSPASITTRSNNNATTNTSVNNTSNTIINNTNINNKFDKIKRQRRLRGSTHVDDSKDDDEKPRKKKARRTSKLNDVGALKVLENVDPHEPVYCLCQQVSYGEMIGCDNEACEVEWFHFRCVSLVHKPKGKWYCPSCRGDRQSVLSPELAEMQKRAKKGNE